MTKNTTRVRERRKVNWKKVRRKLWRDRYIYIMITPVVVYFLLFHYWPMGWLRMAFYDFKLLKGFSGSEFVGFQHFIDFFTGLDFVNLLKNTLLINIGALCFAFPVPIIFAILLNELVLPRFKKVVQTISYMPYFISMVAFTSMIITFLSPSVGMMGDLYRFLGLDPVHFLGDPKYFRRIMILSGIWQSAGWNAVVYLAALTGLDQEQYEAAMVDGANRWQRMWHITLPGIAPTIIIMLILQVGNLMSLNFEKVYLLQTNSNLAASEVLQTYVYKKGITGYNYSFATTVGLFNSVISLILVAVSNFFSRKFSEISLW